MSQKPETPRELAEALGCAAATGKTVRVEGRGTKRAMAGPTPAAEVVLSTTALDKVRQYEPGDLTIGVEAGIRNAELSRILAEHGQMLPLDPHFAAECTIGGIVAANISGPRRRLYGTARDFVIGMQFATTEGKLVDTGGMVVKNVAGLDMAKLMIGSFGTLAAIVSVNFKLVPAPPMRRTFLLEYPDLRTLMDARDRILAGVLQPAAIDVLNPAAARVLGRSGFVLALEAGGTEAVLERYGRELPDAVKVEDDSFWEAVREFTPRFLERFAKGAVARASCKLTAVGETLGSTEAPCIARAGSGVVYAYFETSGEAAKWIAGRKGVIEFAPEEDKARLDLWPSPGADFELMRRVKRMFDPGNFLNRGKLYGRI